MQDPVRRSAGGTPIPASGRTIVVSLAGRVVTVAVALATLVAVSGCRGHSGSGEDRAKASSPTRACGFQSLGKGWYLNATRSVGCRDARRIFEAYFSARGCNGASAGTCSVRSYRCRYDYRDDVERVRCRTNGRLIAFRSLP
jgi:hypothetical protein